MTEKPSFTPRDVLRAPLGDTFRVRIGAAQKGAGGGASGALGKRLGKALAGKKMAGTRMGGSGRAGWRSGASRPFTGDGRQRVVAKVSYRSHGFRGGGAGGGSGGGGKLLAHASYLQRDGAEREGEKGRFYDAGLDEVRDVGERLHDWAAEDKRHFRIMLAPESGARIVGEDGDLKGFTRETMAKMERDLGVRLDWVAIDHHNTDNPHTHVIVRGRRLDGPELILPREYVTHGLREAVRDVATLHIGARGRDDERLRLDREVYGRSFNRLDQAIARELGGRSEILLQQLGSGRVPAFADALRARARELARMGLAHETRRNVLAFEPDWTERLEAMKPLDVRRELARARLYEKSMGRVAGEVKELGPRGDTPDRAVLVIETPGQGRVLINTSMEAIADLQPGSLVALHPSGRRGQIERLAFHPAAEQAHARAETALDHELDRIVDGQARLLPQTPGVEAALEERARWLEAHGFGVTNAAGKFHFHDGARDALRRAELERAGQEVARARHGVFRDVARSGDLGGERPWTVRETRELFAGRMVVLERGREITLAQLGRGAGVAIGDQVTLSLTIDPTRGAQLEITKALERGLGRGLGLSL